MFVFRRITKDDNQFKLVTGNKTFDELAPNGSLKNYIEQDFISRGNYLTYILLEDQKPNYEIFGLLRYRYINEKEFFEQLSIAKVSKVIVRNIESLLSQHKYSIVYLSRIGISKKYAKCCNICKNFRRFN